MILNRGDVVLAWFPHASGSGGKWRPCAIIQNDEDNQKIANTVVVFITSTLNRRGDKSHVFVDIATPEGQKSGLLHHSLISCNNIATIEKSLIRKVIGELGPVTLHLLDESLKAALALS